MTARTRAVFGMAIIAALFASAANAASGPIDAALKDPSRPPYDIARDEKAKPADMLTFARVAPGAVIVDLIPGGGYDTRLFSKVAGPKGRVFAVVPRYGWTPPSPAQISDAVKQARAEAETVRANAVNAVLHVQDTAGYGNLDVLSFAVDQFGGQFSLPVQADIVWTEHYDDLHKPAAAKADGSALDVVGLDKAIFAALKPGGVFVVSGAGDGAMERAEITAAGFQMDGQSDVPAGQFLLRFKKPTNAPTDKRLTKEAMAGYFGNSMISQTPRHVFFHEDGTYQELGVPGPQDVQGGRWFADAAGHICMLHDFDQRGTLTCYFIPSDKHVGDSWTSDTYGIGRMISFRIERGYVYPPGALATK